MACASIQRGAANCEACSHPAQRLAIVGPQIAELRLDTTAQLAAFEARIVRWMFTLWVGTTVTIAGVLVAAQHFK